MKKSRVIIAAAVLAITLISSFAMAYEFGDKWDFGKCSTCGKVLIHVGKDIMQPAGKQVYFNRSGTIKQIYNDSTWKTCIVIESNSTTFILWHLDGASSDVKKYLGKFYDVNKNGKLYLGNVAKLSSGSHIHVGQRSASYVNASVSTAGALPQCNHKYKGLPKFPEKFKSPDQGLLTFK
jgi:hypothetical protein